MATATTGTGGVSDEGLLTVVKKWPVSIRKVALSFQMPALGTHDDNGDGLYDSLNRLAAGAPGGVWSSEPKSTRLRS